MTRRHTTPHPFSARPFEPLVEQPLQRNMDGGTPSTEDTAPREPTQAEIDARVQELQRARRYRPIEYDRALRDAGGNAETALANVIDRIRDIDDRRFQAEAKELIVSERTLETVQNELKTLKATNAQLEKDKRDAEDRYAVLNGTIREGVIDKFLTDQNVPDAEYMRFVLEHKEGFSIEVDGDGDAAKVVLKKGDQTADYASVVNKDFFTKYPRLAIEGDTTLPKGEQADDGLTPGQRMARARMGTRHPANQQAQGS